MDASKLAPERLRLLASKEVNCWLNHNLARYRRDAFEPILVGPYDSCGRRGFRKCRAPSDAQGILAF
jgi:hypothetical protein